MAIERLTSFFDLSSGEDYALFLNAHYSALGALRPIWRHEDQFDFGTLAECLLNDLHALGCLPWTPSPSAIDTAPEGFAFGISFVIRGARLGSALFRDKVPCQFSASYLDFSPTLSWPYFLQQLEHHVLQNAESGANHQVINGAKHALALVASGLRRRF